mmetsp:Transcript_20637/g.33703  ORF Transcript_20637/g.33703 Transcript_20637/m.33703 type:complete len:508 (-) Transcript_20637:494-2017(-)
MVLLPPLAPSSARTLQKKRILQQVIHNISAHNTSKEAKEKSNTDTTNNTTTNMKVIVNGECFAASGLTLTDSEDRPEKCSDWDEEFGCAEQCGAGLPGTVDLRRLMTPVEKQGDIGSCTANAVAGAYEYLCNLRARETGDEAGDISRLFIYYVARKWDLMCEGRGHHRVKDSGSTIEGAINALVKKGACLEETYPYDPDSCNDTPHSEAFDEAVNYKISKCWNIRTDANEFKHVLSKGYPIIFGCKVTKTTFTHERIISAPNPSEEITGGHAMLIVGYFESDKMFIVRNSWGEGWGNNGYCYMPYDYIANKEFNTGQNYAIHGLTDCDFTPEEGGCGVDMPDFDEEDEEPAADVEVLEEDSDGDSDDEEDDDFDSEDFFSDLAEAKRVFDKFDLDESGKMDMAELSIALMMNGHYVTDDIIDGVMEEYDEDGNGKLGFVEFLHILGIEVPEDLADEESEEEKKEDEEYEDEEDEEEKSCVEESCDDASCEEESCEEEAGEDDDEDES